jgi:hypothetical protein
MGVPLQGCPKSKCRLTCVRMQWEPWTNCALCLLLAVSCGDTGLGLFMLTVSSPRMDCKFCRTHLCMRSVDSKHRKYIEFWLFKSSSFYIHITRSLKVSNDAVVEFVKSIEWPPNSSHLNPSDYHFWEYLITVSIEKSERNVSVLQGNTDMRGLWHMKITSINGRYGFKL